MQARSMGSRIAVMLGVVALGACAPAMKPPSLRLDKVSVEKARLSGMSFDVAFRIRNTNPDPILVEGLEFDLLLNNRRVGRGYYPDVVALGGLDEERIVARVELNWLSLPGAVRSVLEQDRAQGRVEGTFYLRQGQRRAKALHFDSQAQVELR